MFTAVSIRSPAGSYDCQAQPQHVVRHTSVIWKLIKSSSSWVTVSLDDAILCMPATSFVGSGRVTLQYRCHQARAVAAWCGVAQLPCPACRAMQIDCRFRRPPEQQSHWLSTPPARDALVKVKLVDFRQARGRPPVGAYAVLQRRWPLAWLLRR